MPSPFYLFFVSSHNTPQSNYISFYRSSPASHSSPFSFVYFSSFTHLLLPSSLILSTLPLSFLFLLLLIVPLFLLPHQIKDISDFKRLDKNMVAEMDRVLTHDIPLLLQKVTSSCSILLYSMQRYAVLCYPLLYYTLPSYAVRFLLLHCTASPPSY